MGHVYLSRYVGTGTVADPFRPAQADQDFSAIDFRPDPTVRDGFCVVSVPTRDDAPQTLYLGEDLDAAPGPAVRTAIGNRLGFDPGPDLDVRRLVRALLMVHGREDGTRWRPLRPTHRGRWLVRLGADTLVDLPVIRGGTTITENFNTADSDTLGPTLTWTETFGDFDIVSNEASATAAARARADSDLASSDHYAQAVVNLFASTRQGGVACRFASAADTCYAHLTRPNASTTYRLAKIVTGTLTVLTDVSTTAMVSGSVIRLEVSGSSLTGYDDGANVISVTDTSITTGTRCGIAQQSGAGTFDSFEAGDLSSGTTITPGVVAAVVAVPAATVTASATVTPGAVAAVAAVPAPTVTASATITPGVVAAVAAVPAPTVTAGATVTPAAVAAVAAVPAPTVTASSTVTPATVPAVAAVPAPTVLSGTIITPGTVAAVAAVPSVTVLADAQVGAGVVNGAVLVPAPTVTASGTATPTFVAVTVAVLAPTVSTSGDVTYIATTATWRREDSATFRRRDSATYRRR